MQLKSLQIQGFKSFPDKTTLTFNRGITAVVGPNGSGKSNISDAIAWVLGEQSIRSLRGEKMEDVIFLGAPNRKATGFAYAALTFGNEDRYFPIESDEVTISRKLYRSGESEYRINNMAVRLKDINELLMDTGLGRDGYSIIGQGRIDEIVSAKSTQRREIFEEAAGISKYQYRRTEAEKKLASAYDNLVRLKDIMAELEERVLPLREQAEKAQQFLELSQEKKVAEVSLWCYDSSQKRQELQLLEQRFLIARNRTQDVQAILTEYENKIEDAYQAVQNKSAELQAIRKEATAHREQAARLEAEVAVLQNDILHHNRSVQELQAAAEQQGQSQKENEALLLQNEQTVEQKEKALLELLQEQKQLEKQAQIHLEQWQRAAETVAELKNRRNAYEQNIAKQKLNNASASSLLSEAKKRLSDLDLARQTGQENLSALQQEVLQCNELIENIEQKRISLQNTLKGYQLKLQGRQQLWQEKQHQQEQLENQARQLLQKARILEDMEHSMEGFQNSVKQVMSANRSGRLKGVCGTVSQLLTVEQQYAVAIETALGAAMQNIVVEDEASAKAAIQYLKFSKNGRCTFLPLSTIKPQQLHGTEVEKEPGFVGVGAQLVEYNSRYKNVVSSLLGRVVVVETIDHAIAMARKHNHQFRIVTMDGQLMNAGGSMTGGSTIKNSGILSRRAEIKNLHCQAKELQSEKEKLEPELKAHHSEMTQLQAALAHLQAQLKTVEEDGITYLSERKYLENSLLAAEQSYEEQKREYAKVEQRLNTLQNSSQNAEELIAKISGELAQILQEVDHQKDQLQKLTQLKEKNAEERNAKKFQVLTLSKDIEALKAVQNQLSVVKLEQKEQQRLFAEKAAAAMEAAKHTQEAVEQKQQQRQQEQAAAAQAEKTAGETMTTMLEQEQSLTQMRSREKEYIAQKEKAAAEQERLHGQCTALQVEYDKVIAALWDEYALTRTQAEKIAKPVEDPVRVRARLMELKSRIKALGNINVAAIEEYNEVFQRYEFLKAQVEDVERSRRELLSLIHELTAQMRDLFQKNFTAIAQNFTAIFTELFGGGKGQLVLTDPKDILTSGIEIQVQPPGKIIKNLSALSGGEKTLVAIAVYFAILRTKPSPFCVLDEIEAALDEVNVVRYAQYLRRFAQNTQFISITHRRGTMESADVMYGVTMQEKGVSRLLELDITQVEKKIGL